MALGTPVSNVTLNAGASPSAPTFHAVLRFAGDGAYPTGGTASFEAFVATALGKESVDVLYVVDGAHSNIDYRLIYDRANGKLKAQVCSTGAEVANTTDLSGVTFNCTVVYR